MKDLLDALPEAVAPELVLDAGHEDSPALPPDDDDVIRPAAEEDLIALGADGSLANVGDAPLAKHLLWTFGPHHRDFPLMLQLRVEVDGERLVTVDPEIGWHHQGLERALEGRTFADAFPLVARMQPQDPAGHVLAYALAVERLLDMEHDVPERAQLWRCVVLELSRIRAHLSLLSSLVLAHSERASQLAFFDAARRVSTLVALASRRDATWLLHAVGGLADEVPDAVPEAIERALPEALAHIAAVGDRLWANPAFTDSLAGLGVLDAEEAPGLGITGPALRACGVADDLRHKAPVFAYARATPKLVTHTGGDGLARFAVRLDELAASSAATVRLLAAFKASDAPVRATAPAPEDDRAGGAHVAVKETATASLEIASGEISVLLRAAEGSPSPSRVRLRGPSFPLVAALRRLLTGARLDDVVPILRSLGVSGSDLDR
jgi:NADH-quinone oxidoreductase subunit D